VPPPLLQLVADTARAIKEGRSRAQLLHAVAVDKPPSELKALGAQAITDCFTDPCGWLQQPRSNSCGSSSQQLNSSSSSSSSPDSVQWRDLQALRQLLQPGAVPAGSSCCLVLAGLSTLLLRHAEVEVSIAAVHLHPAA
jgi:hypothetical protein